MNNEQNAGQVDEPTDRLITQAEINAAIKGFDPDLGLAALSSLIERCDIGQAYANAVHSRLGQIPTGLVIVRL